MYKQGTPHRILKIVEGTFDNAALSGFFIDRKSAGLSKRTIAYYKEKPFRFSKYLNENGLRHLHEV